MINLRCPLGRLTNDLLQHKLGHTIIAFSTRLQIARRERRNQVKKCGTKTSDITTHRLHATGVIEDYSPSFSLLELSALRDLHIFEILFVLERIHQLRLSCGGVDEDDATFAAHASTLAATSVRPISD